MPSPATHELDSPPWLRVEMTLMATARLIREAYDVRFASFGLNLTLASILAYVGDFSPVTQSKIADHLGQGRAATGTSIDRLQVLGLIERRPDVDDRRVWQIHLTDDGRSMAERIAAIDTELRTELRTGLSRADRQALAQVMQQLQGNLRRALATPVPTDPDHYTSGDTHMTDAVIIDAIRTPGGKRNGKLKDWHPAALAAHVLKALEERNGLDPEMVDDVIMGCVMQVGEQSLNIGRNAVLAAGWPESVPATTIDRQCGSSQQAMHFGAQGVIAGAYDVVVAAGVEIMTRTPMGSSSCATWASRSRRSSSTATPSPACRRRASAPT